MPQPCRAAGDPRPPAHHPPPPGATGYRLPPPRALPADRLPASAAHRLPLSAASRESSICPWERYRTESSCSAASSSTVSGRGWLGGAAGAAAAAGVGQMAMGRSSRCWALAREPPLWCCSLAFPRRSARPRRHLGSTRSDFLFTLARPPLDPCIHVLFFVLLFSCRHLLGVWHAGHGPCGQEL